MLSQFSLFLKSRPHSYQHYQRVTFHTQNAEFWWSHQPRCCFWTWTFCRESENIISWRNSRRNNICSQRGLVCVVWGRAFDMRCSGEAVSVYNMQLGANIYVITCINISLLYTVCMHCVASRVAFTAPISHRSYNRVECSIFSGCLQPDTRARVRLLCYARACIGDHWSFTPAISWEGA